ncbi:crossover junction endonuclease MUS81 isoform X3 [Lepisosteus oculatus]|uniref:crossover junction endonuclease MUS81 isoform X3 n=1 Tax=Lepisosteus oculatus TaxID=7918 RepID=UPI000740567E|nr:PREDICTED: crossover junction endonuclease MUS81 isoform X3 [Lepisosteus oculatus]
MASGQVQFGRKRAVPGCPNPLFLRWLTELRDSAAEKGQRTQFTYQKAIGSLRKYPLPLRNGREAKILQHFGDGICRILDERLEQYYSEHGPDAPIHSLPEDDAPPPRRNRSAEPPPERPQASPRKRRQPAGGGGRRAREYVPQKGSGGYAVLVALYRHSQAAGSCGFLLKSELQREAQPLCDKSFTLPEPGSKYTAWSSVSTLIQKDLLLKTHSPARYSLTEKGRELAERLEKRGSPLKDGAQGSQTVDLTEEEEEEGEEEPQPGETRTECEEEPAVALPARTGAEDPGLSGAGNSQASGSSKASWGGSSDPTPEVTLLPGTFEILLCVDFIETTGGSSARKQELVLELRRNGVQFDVRKLHVGDFLWVARQRVDFVPAARPPSTRAGAGLHRGAEENGRLVWEHHRRPLPGAEVPAQALWAEEADIPGGELSICNSPEPPREHSEPGHRQHTGCGWVFRQAHAGCPRVCCLPHGHDPVLAEDLREPHPAESLRGRGLGCPAPTAPPLADTPLLSSHLHRLQPGSCEEQGSDGEGSLCSTANADQWHLWRQGCSSSRAVQHCEQSAAGLRQLHHRAGEGETAVLRPIRQTAQESGPRAEPHSVPAVLHARAPALEGLEVPGERWTLGTARRPGQGGGRSSAPRPASRRQEGSSGATAMALPAEEEEEEEGGATSAL